MFHEQNKQGSDLVGCDDIVSEMDTDVSGKTAGTTSLDNDQLDANLLYFTIRPLHSSKCFKHKCSSSGG